MPQLDFTIIFPQIFWLCSLFSIFYFSLTFYLLPKFLTALKLRKFILEENSKKSILQSSTLIESQLKSKKNLNQKLEVLLLNFEKMNYSLKKTSEITNSKLVDSKLITSTTQLILFCDSIIFQNILFYPNVFPRSKNN